MAWSDKENDAVVKTLAVVCEITQTEYSAPARQLVVRQLSAYPVRQVLGALERCAAECRFKLTLADVISRLDDGRPGAEQAWASFPKSEDLAGLVTDEMSAAWGAAAPLYASDKVGARMAFKEAYDREIRQARAEGKAPKWRVSPGFDKAHTESIAIEGMKNRLFSPPEALQYIHPDNHANALHIAGLGPKALPPSADVARVKELVGDVVAKLQDRNPPHWTDTDRE